MNFCSKLKIRHWKQQKIIRTCLC